MYVLLITRLLRLVGRWARKPVNHISWVAVATPTDRPKSVRNCCIIELFCGVVYVVTLPFGDNMVPTYDGQLSRMSRMDHAFSVVDR